MDISGSFTTFCSNKMFAHVLCAMPCAIIVVSNLYLDINVVHFFTFILRFSNNLSSMFLCISNLWPYQQLLTIAKNLTEFRTFYQYSTNFCPLKYEKHFRQQLFSDFNFIRNVENYVHARTVERKPLINTVFQS
jgi:hypothetical protein